MKKALTQTTKLYHYNNGNRVDGKNDDMTGDCTGLIGDCTGLEGNCTGLEGNCTGLWGNLDDCEITDDERDNGIDIQDLVL